jgi:Flp pilus assembly protein TadD
LFFGYATLCGAGESLEAVFEKAASALASQDYPAAERGFQAVLQVQPRNVGALGNLGVVYSRTHRYAEAIDIYRRALRAAPGDKGLETNLGLAYVKQEQFALAQPIFEKLAADPKNRQAHELLATCHLARGQLDAALTLLKPLAASDPTDSGVLYLLGVTYVKLKRGEEARQAFTKMMETVGSAQANFLMGKASYETGRFEEAADYFRKALQADPKPEGAHRELGKTLISLRDNDGAEKELRQADERDPEALYFLGGLLALSRPDEAFPVLIRARQASPDAWGPLYYLGRIYLDRGDVKQALVCLERAAKLKADEPAVHYQLGRALRKAGREAEARNAFAVVKRLKETTLKSEIDVLSPERNH